MTSTATVELLFGFNTAVTRRIYFTAGVLLFALKYGVDLALSFAFATNPLDPLTYANPLLFQRLEGLGEYPGWLPLVMFSGARVGDQLANSSRNGELAPARSWSQTAIGYTRRMGWLR
jgi:hypothetical protein